MTETAPTSSSARATIWSLAVIVTLTCIAYFPVVRAGYIWDDDDYVTENPLLLNAQGMWDIWFSIKQPSQYFPLTYASFWFEYRLWGEHPLGYHINNVLLHAANACLVWIILCRLKIPGAMIASLLFAVHPVHVESVAWVTERKNTLSTLFYLLATLQWVKWLDVSTSVSVPIDEMQKGEPGTKPHRHWWLAMLFFVLAMFAKTTACTLAPILILIAHLSGHRLDRRLLLRIVPFFFAGLVMGLITIWYEHVKQGTSGQQFAMSMVDRVSLASRALWFYLGKLFWPMDLSFSYTRWDLGSRPMIWLAYCLACVSLLAGIILAQRRIGRWAIVASGFFFCSLLPLIGFIPLYTFLYSFVADHYQYVASIAPLAAVGAGMARLKLRMVLVAPIIAVLIGLTIHRAGIYQNSETLWRDTLAKNPNSWMVNLNLGQVLATDPSKKAEAIASFERAYELAPDRIDTQYRLGTARIAQDRLDEALAIFDQVISVEPKFAEAYFAKAGVLETRGQVDEAEVWYRKSVAVRPTYAQAWFALAVLLESRNRQEEAAEAYLASLLHKPNYAAAHYNLAGIYRKRMQFAEAESHLRHAIAADPDWAEAHVNLGDLLFAQRRFSESAKYFESALQIRPDLTVARRGLDAARARQ